MDVASITLVYYVPKYYHISGLTSSSGFPKVSLFVIAFLESECLEKTKSINSKSVSSNEEFNK